MNRYSNEIDNAREAYEKRRKKVIEMKRKRQKKLTMIKRMIVAAVVLVIMVTASVLSIYNAKSNDKESTMDEKQTLEVAVNVDNSYDKAPAGPLLSYPFESPSYQEITDSAVDSQYIALLDTQNREVIAGRNYNERIYPASMTKVMTIIVAVEHMQNMDQTFTMTADIITPLVKEQASRAGFDPNEVITMKDLLYGLILPSGADSAVALAQITAGSEDAFAELMNEKCDALGLKNTHFTNASGLYNDEQYTTPMEMAMIMEYAMKNPSIAEVLSTYQYRTTATEQHPEGILLTSTMFSRMYGNEVEGVSIIAGKTGYTDEAGNCLVTYALKDGKPYVAVLADASYKWHSIFDDFEVYKSYLK